MYSLAFGAPQWMRVGTTDPLSQNGMLPPFRQFNVWDIKQQQLRTHHIKYTHACMHVHWHHDFTADHRGWKVYLHPWHPLASSWPRTWNSWAWCSIHFENPFGLLTFGFIMYACMPVFSDLHSICTRTPFFFSAISLLRFLIFEGQFR